MIKVDRVEKKMTLKDMNVANTKIFHELRITACNDAPNIAVQIECLDFSAASKI